MGITYHEVEKLLLEMMKSSTHIKNGYIKKTTNQYAYLKLDKMRDVANSVLDRLANQERDTKTCLEVSLLCFYE
ncbi:MAG: hypothetical protein ACLT12_03475 [Lactococcus lactis]